MKTKTINIVEETILCEKAESHFFDKKAKEIAPASLLKHIVAFANADGGEVIIGIKDDNAENDSSKRWDGHSNFENFNPIIKLISELKPSINLEPVFLKSASKQTYVLQLIIEKSEKLHYTTAQEVYVRQSAQSCKISDHNKIQELSFAKGETSFEDFLIKDAATEDVTESKEIQSFLNDVSPVSDPLEFSLNQNLVDKKTYDPKAAGILLFANNPSAILPRKCAVKISRYATNENIPERDNLREQYTIEGPLYTLIHETVMGVNQVMSNISTWTSRGLEKVDYPDETIWEIVANAIIHRDYSISDDIHVLIFDNRIEVISPGKLPGYVTIDNILEARYSRNPRIVRTLNRYKNPPNKDIGEGLNTAFQKMHEFSLKEPIITVEGHYVKVIIPHQPLASPEDTILEYLKNNSTIKNERVRELTGIKSENTVKNHFYKLRDAGLIERVEGQGGSASAWKLKGT